jgi:feruloyl-CoA synthase
VIAWVKPAVRAAVLEAVGEDNVEAELRRRVTAELSAYNRDNGTSTRRVVAFALLRRALSLGAGEVTDKGNVNQGAVLRSEAALVEELYRPEGSGRVTRLACSQTATAEFQSA